MPHLAKLLDVPAHYWLSINYLTFDRDVRASAGRFGPNRSSKVSRSSDEQHCRHDQAEKDNGRAERGCRKAPRECHA